MTTASIPTASIPTADPMGLVPIRSQRFSTLVAVEVRKQLDTRSGRTLLGVTVGAVVALLGWKLLHTTEMPPSFVNYTQATRATVTTLLPVLGLLAMTSEWTQRTALTTFTISPRRLRVIGAKFVAALLVALVVLVLCLLLTAGAAAIGGRIAPGGMGFDHLGDQLWSTTVATVCQVVMGAAFGALVPVTAAALGAFLLAPTVWSVLGPTILGHSARWLDVFEAYSRIGSSEPGLHLAQTLTAIAAWVVVPLVVGVHRSLHREAK
jgi:hypothetical protein